MKVSTSYFLDSVFSVAVFAAIVLAIASTAYQIFNPDGGLLQWIGREWQNHPLTLLLLAGLGMLVKVWLSGMQSGRIADGLYYGTLLVGVFCGYRIFFM